MSTELPKGPKNPLSQGLGEAIRAGRLRKPLGGNLKHLGKGTRHEGISCGTLAKKKGFTKGGRGAKKGTANLWWLEFRHNGGAGGTTGCFQTFSRIKTNRHVLPSGRGSTKKIKIRAEGIRKKLFTAGHKSAKRS